MEVEEMVKAEATNNNNDVKSKIIEMECKDCRQIMNNSDGCTYEYVAFADKPEKLFPRDRTHSDEESGRCHDCGAIHGNIHHFGCDVEKCPKCGGQLAFNCCYKERPFFWIFSFKDEDLV